MVAAAGILFMMNLDSFERRDYAEPPYGRPIEVSLRNEEGHLFIRCGGCGRKNYFMEANQS